MRYIVLILSLAGLVGAGVLGYVWMEETKEHNDELGPDSLLRKSPLPLVFYNKMMEFDRRTQAWPFLLGGAGVGLAGAILAYERRRFSGSALLLSGAVGIVLFHPSQWYVILFGSAVVLAGVLALFIAPSRPKPDFML